ncbi:SUMF1/EgtB/PvdO family nonheme iron enzyme [Marinobacterium jannaschii]|uniref:SUMF1/EgtB/PvdO family nonheme iron enzyme n=1 Tax=Marinobacterium jannaschii TaxID=64970 RepID=UPI000688576A|nr:SUMF1/EgtB/PvdO family nonheme iron enzyme [Marinobacterium jannaschii]
MSTTQAQRYNELTPEQVIGPSHHRYKLIQSGDRWALGDQWRAEDISAAGRPEVTLLFLDALLTEAPARINTLKRHLTDSRRLNHKHILQLYGLMADNGLLFLAHEPVDGTTLSELFSDERRSALNPAQQKALLIQIAAAIEIGHRRQITHGALCPDLIFVNRRGGIKVSSFNLRPMLDTLSDQLASAPDFASCQAPEAFHPGNLSPRSDVYSLACIAYQLFTGNTVEPPDSNNKRKLLTKPDNLSTSQWEALQQALSKEPEQRQPSVIELVQALFKEEDDTEAEIAENEDTPADSVADGSKTDPAPDEAGKTAEVKEKPAKLAGRFSFSLPKLRWLKPLLIGSGLLTTGYLLAFFVHADKQRLQTASDENQQLKSQLAELQLTLQQQTEALALASERQAATQLELANAKASKVDQGDTDAPGQKVFADLIGESAIYGPEMVLLPAGSFNMGDQHKIGDDNEQPVHEVTIANPFALSRFEVTFEQYDLFAEASGRPLPDDGGWGRGKRPVTNVSWYDARAFSKWLAKETGQPYRLPTEAEWEYAARAGTTSAYWWGDKLQPGYAVCDECGSEWDGKSSAPVGSFQPNPWGLYDLTGNIYEWVADCYNDSYKDTPTDGSASRSGECQYRVMRGGSWFEIGRLIRPASRYRYAIDEHRDSWGFRVALDVTPQ